MEEVSLLTFESTFYTVANGLVFLIVNALDNSVANLLLSISVCSRRDQHTVQLGGGLGNEGIELARGGKSGVDLGSFSDHGVVGAFKVVSCTFHGLFNNLDLAGQIRASGWDSRVVSENC